MWKGKGGVIDSKYIKQKVESEDSEDNYKPQSLEVCDEEETPRDKKQ